MKCERIHLKELFPKLGEGERDPFVDLYLPYNMVQMNRQDQLRPAILLCPGGGYGMVSEREWEPIVLHLLPMGYNVYVLKYSTKCPFPTQLREVAAAMELIYSNAAQWNTDTDRIAIMGFSAGGHLACHYSNCYDCPEVRELFPESKGVKAAVLCYPVIACDSRYWHIGTFRNLSGHQEPTVEDAEKYSLQLKVTDRTPPTFLWHTRTDELVPIMNSLLYAQALAEHNVPFALHVYPNGVHGLATVDAETCRAVDEKSKLAADWFNQLEKWLKITL